MLPSSCSFALDLARPGGALVDVGARIAFARTFCKIATFFSWSRMHPDLEIEIARSGRHAALQQQELFPAGEVDDVLRDVSI